MSNKLNLTDNEKRDIIKYLESGKPLPEKYRFLLFDTDREVELVWNGKTDEVENMVLPFQTIEHIDEPRSEEKITAQTSLFDTSGRQIKGWSNKLIWGDNKLILSSLKNGPLRKQIEAEGGLKLIYIDPPFDVGADFSMNIEIGGSAGSPQAETFVKKPSVIEEIAYRDTWGRGADSFIAMIYERLKLMHGLLSDDGSIYVHCDYRVSGFIRLVLDEIFGDSNFRNEIVWGYRTGGISKVLFARKHDVIFFYSKDFSKVKFNTQYYKSYQQKKYNFKGVEDLWDEEKKQWYHNSVCRDVWEDVFPIGTENSERIDYPTQKPEALLERVINASTNEGDLVADFFCGSGTTLAVAEKLGRKWIGSDLGRFSIHTTRKRMIGVQRELKKAGKDFRAFEILNIGKYEREKFLGVNENLREEEKRIQRENKEKEFIKLILSAYKAEPVDSFNTFVGKKRDRLVAVGSIDTPVTNDFLERIIKECKEKKITKADVLGFDYEMGLDFESAKKLGIDVQFKVIPREVFDKKAVEKGQVRFYDVAYIDVKPIIRLPARGLPVRCTQTGTQAGGRDNVKEIAIELTDFSVFYNQDNTGEVEEKLRSGGNKIIIENGQVIKISKDLPAPQSFLVYVIECDNKSFYIGQTDNMFRRWEEHKQGKVSWTKKYKPVEVIHYENFETRDEVVKREKELKTGFGRKWLKREYEKKCLNKWNENMARQAGKQTGIISKEVLTKKWTDWVDYWSVDFNFESKQEIIRTVDEKTGEEKEEWTGGYIFENEWQSFRTKKDRTLELTSAFKDGQKGKMKIAIKVIDIFGNDTTKVIEVNI